MQDILMKLVDVPLARMFVLAAIIFLLVAVLGKIEGKIEPGKIGRIGATVVGILLMASGLAMHFIDAEELRDKLRGGVNPPLSASARLSGDVLAGGTARNFPASSAVVLQAVASQGGAGSADKAAAIEKAENVRSAIKVVAGTYGRNCGVKPGNATTQWRGAGTGKAVANTKSTPPRWKTRPRTAPRISPPSGNAEPLLPYTLSPYRPAPCGANSCGLPA